MISLMVKISLFLISIFILLFFFKSVSTSYKLVASSKWNEVSAVLTKYKTYGLQTNTTGSAALSAPMKNGQYLDVGYKFNIDSQQFTGNKVDVNPNELFVGKNGEEFLKLWVGDFVKVKYNPQKPSENYMTTGMDDSISLSIFKTILSLILLLLSCWYFFIKS